MGGQVNSFYNILFDAFNRPAKAISGLYAAINSDIRQKAVRAVLTHSANRAAAALSGSHVERYLSENHRYLANSYQGLAVIQAAHLHSLRILDKLQEIKQLAQNASDGLYSQDQLSQAQQKFSNLIIEINALAAQTHPGGFFMLSETAFGSVGIQVDRNKKIEIDSMDMTAAGLGLTQSLDLKADPDDVLASVQIAIEEVTAYRQHLIESRVAIEESIDTLNNEREAILPALITVGESRSALNTVRALAVALEESSILSIAIQARIESDRVIRLLLGQKK
jgi:flagellin